MIQKRALRRLACPFLAMMLIANALWAQSVEVPDTAAGKRLGQMLGALKNEGPELETFIHEGFEKRKPEDIERREELSTQLKSQLGSLTVKRILESTPELVRASCASETGSVVNVTIQVTPHNPHRIEMIQLEVAGEDDQAPTDDTAPLSADEKAAVLETLQQELKAKYVFPEVADQMCKSLQQAVQQDKYAEVISPTQFATQLTKQLREICRDKHLSVRPGMLRRPGSARGRRPVDNHGFVKVESLPGGIGYLKFNYFSGDPQAEETAAAAMNFLANSKAIIFDLRQNGGGSPSMIAFLSGYLFDESVHLNSFYNRPTDTTTESWSRADVPGMKYGQQKPVYVLTSNYTFSGAEEFSYNLKNLKRGTLVGETTGGGAHPIMPVKLGDRFHMSMPFARAINPITKTNWEGTGVSPHVKVTADAALETAMELAQEAIAKAKTNAKATASADIETLLDEAREFMNSQEFRKAIDLAERVLELDPNNSLAWFQLGYCLHLDGQIDRAIEAHKKAAKFDTTTGRVAAYNLACAYSLKGKPDAAMNALEEAIERGFDDANQIRTDSDLDGLRSHDRFKKIVAKLND